MSKKRKRKKTKNSRKKTRRIKRPRRRIRKIKRPKRKNRKVKKPRRKISSKKKRITKTPIQSKDSDGNAIIKVSDNWANHAYVNESKYKKKYRLSIKENEKFWAKEGKRISWIKNIQK